MKIVIMAFLSLQISACSYFHGVSDKTQEAYYVPVIQGDKSVSDSPGVTPVQISDQDRSSQDPYVPVIVP